MRNASSSLLWSVNDCLRQPGLRGMASRGEYAWSLGNVTKAILGIFGYKAEVFHD